MAPEPVPEVVPEEVPVEGAMIAARTAAPSPSHSAPVPFSPAPRIAAVAGAASDAGLEVVLGHPTPYALDHIPLGEAEGRQSSVCLAQEAPDALCFSISGGLEVL
jgi:hypothetical protein